VRTRVGLFVLTFFSLSCAAPRAGTRVMWLPTYLYGAIGGGDVDVRDVCASGKARDLAVGQSVATLGIAVATLGIYTPREARVRCEPLR